MREESTQLCMSDRLRLRSSFRNFFSNHNSASNARISSSIHHWYLSNQFANPLPASVDGTRSSLMATSTGSRVCVSNRL